MLLNGLGAVSRTMGGRVGGVVGAGFSWLFSCVNKSGFGNG